jgi:hypothetical protein
MLNINELPVWATFYSVSEEQWFAAGADENGDVYGDRDFRPIADCATFEDARDAALQAGDVRGRIYIDKVVRGERGAMGSPIFAGYQSEPRADLRMPVQSAGSSVFRRTAGGLIRFSVGLERTSVPRPPGTSNQ